MIESTIRDRVLSPLRGTALCGLIFALLMAGGCATTRPDGKALALLPPTYDNSLYSRHLPILVIHNPDSDYNRVGRIVIKKDRVAVDPDDPAVYVRTENFSTPRGRYRNLIYRFHFKEVPFSLVPFHLTAGKNVGLIVVVTLDENDKTILFTTVHTCGCYLAFLPSREIDPEMLPPGWPKNRQKILGERLPAFIDGKKEGRILLDIRPATHRVMEARWLDNEEAAGLRPGQRIKILPYSSLDDDRTGSIFVKKGLRRGYVKESHKPFEMLLMGWWTLDPFIGEDKDLGDHRNTGTRFYTSLKFWARENSDMADFARFLKYWGWRL